MKKSVVVIILLIILIALGILLFGKGGEAPTEVDEQEVVEEENGGEVSEESDEEVDTETSTLRGVVTDIDSEGVVVDKPYLVTIEGDLGSEAVIAIPSMGINLCAAREDIVDVSTLSVGDIVEVRGAVNEDGTITPCEENDHYLRVQD